MDISHFIAKSSRDVFGDMLVQLAQHDGDIVALSADVADSVKLGAFKKAYPDRFFNFGIAEQNMMAAAAGMARSGKTPFISVYAVFAALRAIEQLRTDIVYQNLKARICVSHSGISLGQGGPTHFTIEDLAILRALPNMTVIVPADGVATALCMRQFHTIPGPIYMRMNRFVEKTVYQTDRFKFGRINRIQEGKHAAILACGASVGEAMEASRQLEQSNTQVAVFDVHMIKPIHVSDVCEIAKSYPLLITVEEHNYIGGLGSSVAEIIAGMENPPRLVRLGIPDIFPNAGAYEDIIKDLRLDGQGIAVTVQRILRENSI